MKLEKRIHRVQKRDHQEPSSYFVKTLLQWIGSRETQILFKMQEHGEPVWNHVTMDRLWVTTKRGNDRIWSATNTGGKPPGSSAGEKFYCSEGKGAGDEVEVLDDERALRNRLVDAFARTVVSIFPPV